MFERYELQNGGYKLRNATGSELHYFNSKNQHHREDGPARMWPDGGKEWWINNKRHRENGPAIETASGYKEWWINGQVHRVDGPAIERPDGRKEWWIEDKQLSEEEFDNRGIRTVDEHGIVRYRNKDGQLHREGAPAVEDSEGSKEWYRNGKQHREDGPAVEWGTSHKEWWIDGKQLSQQEFLEATGKAPRKSDYEKLMESLSLSSEQLAVLKSGPPKSEKKKAEKQLRDII